MYGKKNAKTIIGVIGVITFTTAVFLKNNKICTFLTCFLAI